MPCTYTAATDGASTDWVHMATPADLRESELERIRDLLDRATREELDAAEHPPVDRALSLLSKRDDLRILVGRMIADALLD